MKKIVLIACAKSKRALKSTAEDLYTSPLFAGNLRYARSLKPDQIFILSAKYGLLELDQVVEPYDQTLKTMSSTQVKVWADQVLEQIRQRADLRNDHFVFLAGDRYRKHLAPHMASYEVPMAGMSIGRQLQYLAVQTHE